MAYSTYSVEDLRDYITDLYCDQQYTERQILTALLDHGVQTYADHLRRHLELWQLNTASAPPQGAKPPRTSGYGISRPDPTFTNDRLQEFLREDHAHERLALRMTNLPRNDSNNENIDLPEQSSNH